jgi:hypothetical protein
MVVLLDEKAAPIAPLLARRVGGHTPYLANDLTA